MIPFFRPSIRHVFALFLFSLFILTGCFARLPEREIQIAVSNTLTSIAVDQGKASETQTPIMNASPTLGRHDVGAAEPTAPGVIQDIETPTAEPVRVRSTPTLAGAREARIKPTARLDPTVVATISSQVLGENLIYNPWFRQPGDPTRSSLDGWSQETEAGAWSTSLKGHNPSPDQHTGTSARWAFGQGMGGGPGVGGANAYLYQVVASNPSHQTLQFQMWWIVQWISEAKVTIYASDSGEGPWIEVWIPFITTTPQGGKGAWAQTALLETHLERGYNYYKIELHGRYPESHTAGVKYTGVFFTTAP